MKLQRLRRFYRDDKIEGPLIKAKIEREKFKEIDYEERCDDDGISLIQNRSGVYGLFYGDALQYVGRVVDLKDRLRQHLDNKINKTDGHVLFGNYSWYDLHSKQISNAKDFLIRYYESPYNIINGKRREGKIVDVLCKYN